MGFQAAFPTSTPKHHIPPPWYQLQSSASGHPYILLPPRSSVNNVFLTALYFTDAGALQATLEIPSINDRLISVPKPYTLAEATSWITLQFSGTSYLPLQAIRTGDPETGSLIGSVSLVPLELPSVHTKSNDAPAPEKWKYKLGYWLHPDFHR
jgi:hypothetical protein